MAVAVGADVLHQADVEAGPPGADRRGVLGHLAVQLLVGAVVDGVDGVEAARADAAAAALAQVVVDHGLVLGVVADGVRAALLGAAVAAAAQLALDGRRAGGVLLHLAGAAAAAHPDVLDRPAEAGGLMPLEVGQADKDVGVHDGAADLGGLAEFAVGHRHLDLVGAAQPVADQHLAAGGHRPEAVQLGALEMLEGVFPLAGVEGVAVGQKGHAALLFAQVGHHLGVVGPQEGQVAQLPKVHLDGHEAPVHLNIPDPRRQTQPAQLLGQAGTHRAPKIGKIYSGTFHNILLTGGSPAAWSLYSKV